MNRRGFLSLLGAGAAGFALDPERLLWRPGAKTIFLPAATEYAFLYDHIDREVFKIMFEASKDTAKAWRDLMGPPLANNKWPATHGI